MDFLALILKLIDTNAEAYTGAKRFFSHGLVRMINNGDGLPTPWNYKLQEWAVSDDKFDVSLYHRFDTTSFEKIQGRGGSVFYKETLNMRMVAFGKINELDYSEYVFQQRLARAVTVIGAKIQNLDIFSSEVVSGATNSIEVYNAELPGLEIHGFDELMAISLAYNINLQYDPKCLNLCQPKPAICV